LLRCDKFDGLCKHRDDAGSSLDLVPWVHFLKNNFVFF
jgi:hypothetical protein